MKRWQGNIEGHNVMLFVAQNERKRKPEVIAKMMNHLSKDNIQGHFTRKLFFVMVFMLGQITIRVRNYIYYPSCRSGNKYPYKRKIDACY